jgi:hypothetical protein
MGKDVIWLMNILLVECHSCGEQITRWFWEYHLMKGMDQLRTGRADPQMRMRGMYVCLVLLAKSTNFPAPMESFNFIKRDYWIPWMHLPMQTWAQSYPASKDVAVGGLGFYPLPLTTVRIGK